MDRRLFLSGLAAGASTGLAIPAHAVITPVQQEDQDEEFDILRRIRVPWLRQVATGQPNLFRRPAIPANAFSDFGLRLVQIARVGTPGASVPLRIRPLIQPMITTDANRAGAPRQGDAGMQFLSNVRLSGDPALVVRVAETQLLTKTSIVVGGLIHDVPETGQMTEAPVPFLGDLPVVGHLFRRGTATQEQQELVIFLTPRIIRGT